MGKYELHFLDGVLDNKAVYSWRLERMDGEVVESSAFVNRAKAMSNCVDELGEEVTSAAVRFFNLTFGQISLLRASARHRVPIRRP